MIAVALAALALAAPIDDALEDAAGRHPAQAAVYACGKLAWAGSANTTPASRFVLASTTKPYVATMVMQLVERGTITLDTKLARYYPRLPNARRITVRMLLAHRSGLQEYFDGENFQRAVKDPKHRWTRDEVLADVKRAVFPPGARFQYTNTNYVVLGGILEQAARMTIPRLFAERIARPARLARTSWTSPPSGAPVGSDYYGPVWTDGGLTSTAADVARFGDALFRGSLLSARTRRTMVEGRLGLFPSGGWVGHDGSYGGFEAQLWHHAARGVTVAVATRGGDSEEIWQAVADAYEGSC